MPVIGLTTSDTLNSAGNPYAMVSTHYIRAVLQAGGTPVLIPNQLPEADWLTLFERLDGILFTGGGDIATEIFGGVDHPRVSGIEPERDSLELPMLRRAAESGKPFLGICRGLQVTNVALGGTLYTHISDQHPGAQRHDWYPDIPRDYHAHPVRVEEGSRIAEIFGQPLLEVNSLHHQGIRDLAPALKAVGFAPDGLIEAVELPNHRFGFAVQWHPEWLTDQEPMRRLFKAFVDASKDSDKG
jgi:putative glutamine amidotransferase